jgi:hypothetical protein
MDYGMENGSPTAGVGQKVTWMVWEALGHFGVEGRRKDGACAREGKNLKKSSLSA